MRDWVAERPEYLARLLQLEAPPPGSPCSACNHKNSIYRCRDCYGSPLYCDKCLRSLHARNPCHRIEVWTGTFFQQTSLRKIGLCLHLGHYGNICPCYGNSTPSTPAPHFPEAQAEFAPDMEAGPEPNDYLDEDVIDEEALRDANGTMNLEDFQPPKGVDGQGNPWITVVHTTGVHFLKAKFCRCPNALARQFQLLDAGLYPATQRRPRTAFTFQVLDDFYIENLECKTPALNYYSKLRRLTSSLFPHLVPVSDENVWLVYS